MEELKIDLRFNRVDFKEIYQGYNNKEKNLITARRTKKPTIIVMMLTALSIGLYILANQHATGSTIFLFVMNVLFNVLAIIYLSIEAVQFYKRKSVINKYLDRLAKYKAYCK